MQYMRECGGRHRVLEASVARTESEKPVLAALDEIKAASKQSADTFTAAVELLNKAASLNERPIGKPSTDVQQAPERQELNTLQRVGGVCGCQSGCTVS